MRFKLIFSIGIYCFLVLSLHANNQYLTIFEYGESHFSQGNWQSAKESYDEVLEWLVSLPSEQRCDCDVGTILINRAICNGNLNDLEACLNDFDSFYSQMPSCLNVNYEKIKNDGTENIDCPTACKMWADVARSQAINLRLALYKMAIDAIYQMEQECIECCRKGGNMNRCTESLRNRVAHYKRWNGG